MKLKRTGRYVMSVSEITDKIKELQPDYVWTASPRRVGWYLRSRLGLKTRKVWIKDKSSNPYCVDLTDPVTQKQLDLLVKQYFGSEEEI